MFGNEAIDLKLQLHCRHLEAFGVDCHLASNLFRLKKIDIYFKILIGKCLLFNSYFVDEEKVSALHWIEQVCLCCLHFFVLHLK